MPDWIDDDDTDDTPGEYLEDRQYFELHGGPFDGIVLEISSDMQTPSELVFREDEIAPGWDAVYRRRPVPMAILPLPAWAFDYTGDTEGRRNELWYRQQFVWRDQEILRLTARLKRQAGWISKLRGTIKAMKTRAAKKKAAEKKNKKTKGDVS